MSHDHWHGGLTSALLSSSETIWSTAFRVSKELHSGLASQPLRKIRKGKLQKTIGRLRKYGIEVRHAPAWLKSHRATDLKKHCSKWLRRPYDVVGSSVGILSGSPSPIIQPSPWHCVGSTQPAPIVPSLGSTRCRYLVEITTHRRRRTQPSRPPEEPSGAL